MIEASLGLWTKEDFQKKLRATYKTNEDSGSFQSTLERATD